MTVAGCRLPAIDSLRRPARRTFPTLVEAQGTAFSQRQVVLQPQLFVRGSSLHQGPGPG